MTAQVIDAMEKINKEIRKKKKENPGLWVWLIADRVLSWPLSCMQKILIQYDLLPSAIAITANQ